MTSRPRRRATAIEYVYAAGLAALAIAGLLAPARPLPGSVRWEGPFPVVALGPDVAPPEVEVHRSVDLEVLVQAPPGDPYDAEASATFVHEASGQEYTVQAHYAGGREGRAVFRFRFTPLQAGEWRFLTSSELAGLGGHEGAVLAVGGELVGTMTGANGRFVLTKAGGTSVPTTYNVYSPGGYLINDLGSLPRAEGELRDALGALLDSVKGTGFDALHIGVNNEWFQLGAARWDRHSSVQPDQATFRLLETLLAMAHERGLYIHMWMWGDEARRYTPLGIEPDHVVDGDPGGEDGRAFDRLQRYIAARLGPLPNWTMSYGFDLDEWAEEEQVLAWHDRLSGLLPLPHLLTASEEGGGSRAFRLEGRKLSLVARDRDPLERDEDPYVMARRELSLAASKPLLIESRYPIGSPEGPWSLAASRRVMWRYAMAGGVGALWDVAPAEEGSVPFPPFVPTFNEFWRDRMLGGAAVAERPAPDAYALVAADGGLGVIYAEGTDSVELTLVPVGASVVAVDTQVAYSELPVDTSSGGSWQPPHVSDWALAFEAASD